MDPIAIGRALADLGGWAAFLVVVVLIAVGGYRRWWVWGWMWDRTEADRRTSDTQAERNAESLAAMSKAYEVMARNYDRLELSVTGSPVRRVNRE